MAVMDQSLEARPSSIPVASTGRTTSARQQRVSPKAWLVLADGATIGLGMLLAFAMRSSGGSHDLDGARIAHLVLAAGGLPLWLWLLGRRRLYNVRFLTRRIDEIRRIAGAAIPATMTMTVAAYTFQLPVSRAWLGMSLVLSVALMSVEREVIRRQFVRLRRGGRLLRRVVIVGGNDEARDLAAMLDGSPRYGYQVVGLVDDGDHGGDPLVLGSVDDTLAIVRETNASSVIVAASATSVDTGNRLVRALLREGVHVELSSTLRDIAAHRLTVRPIGPFPIVYVEPIMATGWRSIAKRTFDVTIASVCLVLTAPVAAAIAIAIKLDGGGRVIYHQTRVGKDGRLFEFHKFRSMVENAHEMWIDLREENGSTSPIFKLKNDPRVTRVGRILRKTSLDELPQLWNVLRGDMSLVGPRPALPEEMSMWDEQLHDRLRVRPGLTGMWQVSGRSDAATDDYARLDLYYVDNWSLLTDVVVVLKTIPVVLFGRGAY